MTEIGVKKGFFITFEGSDGAGKSTQVALLREALVKTGFTVTKLREPGSTPIGEEVRCILKNKKYANMCPETELMLISAARAQLVREVITPALARGEVVICDRFYHSTLIYQGIARGLNTDMVKASIHFAVGDVTPDLTFVLFLDKDVAAKRLAARGTDCRFEAENAEFQAKVANGVRWLASQDTGQEGRIVAINADDSEKYVHTEIYRTCAHRISLLKDGQLELNNKILKV